MDRILGLDVQFLLSFALQLINTGVLVFVLYKILYGPVLKFLDARTQRIQGNITSAETARKEAEELKANYETILANADAEKAGIIAEATKRAKEIEESIVATAKEEAARIKQNATRELELQKEKAARDMKDQIIDLSALIAGKYVETSIDEALQIKLLNDTINEIGDATWLS
ncbi:MAG: F0F1 ATP synthase subunit B [Defluviitaleaceae bacterium]|nr:F0F1 ATP synthase subunit B [Defluviitaleaceae bacterium]